MLLRYLSYSPIPPAPCLVYLCHGHPGFFSLALLLSCRLADITTAVDRSLRDIYEEDILEDLRRQLRYRETWRVMCWSETWNAQGCLPVIFFFLSDLLRVI
jgi:hypothetical protein